MPKIVILKKFRQFFENTHLFFRNSHFFERFEFPWAILLFETRARRKMPRLPILEEILDLLKNNIYFSKKHKNLIVLRLPKQFENLTRFLDKKCEAKCSWKISRIFSTEKTSFSRKNPKIWTFSGCISENNVWNNFWSKASMLSVFEKLQEFLEKISSLFPKKPKFWTSRDLMSSSKNRGAFR